jgi:hypothetical protein
MQKSMSEAIKVKCPSELHFLRPVIIENLERVGDYSDGGYAIPLAKIRATEALISLGLGENWSFEKSVSRIKPSLNINIYDHTLSLRFFLVKVIKGLVKLILFKDSLDNFFSRFNRLQDYYFFWIKNPRNNHHRIRVSESSFKELLLNFPTSLLLGLKIDIEGSEWEIFDLIVANQNRFEYFLLEIHDFDLHVDQLRKFINQISNRFVLAHLHANNFETLGTNDFPRVFEITFLRKRDDLLMNGYRTELPVIGLDFPNAKNRPDYSIKFG